MYNLFYHSTFIHSQRAGVCRYMGSTLTWVSFCYIGFVYYGIHGWWIQDFLSEFRL